MEIMPTLTEIAPMVSEEIFAKYMTDKDEPQVIHTSLYVRGDKMYDGAEHI